MYICYAHGTSVEARANTAVTDKSRALAEEHWAKELMHINVRQALNPKGTTLFVMLFYT